MITANIDDFLVTNFTGHLAHNIQKMKLKSLSKCCASQ